MKVPNKDKQMTKNKTKDSYEEPIKSSMIRKKINNLIEGWTKCVNWQFIEAEVQSEHISQVRPHYSRMECKFKQKFYPAS